MKPENELTMEFLSRSCNEAFARAAVGAFIAPSWTPISRNSATSKPPSARQ